MEAAWEALAGDAPALERLVRTLAARWRIDLPADGLRRFESGSLPVFPLGPGHVVKLFPDWEREYAATESRVLRAVDGRLPMATPRVLALDTLQAPGAAAGEGGRPAEPVGVIALLMSRIAGEPLTSAWPRLAAADRGRIAAQLGEGVRALHALDTAPLADLPPSWPAFAAAQRASATERQMARGLAPAWCERIEPFLERWLPPGALQPSRLSLLHTELMRDHVFVAEGVAGWQLAGLIDFEPAMVGAPEYEFASAGLFVAEADAAFLRALLQAYGRDRAELGPALSCRLMGWTLLHRYSNLPWYLRRLPLPGATTLEQLAGHWFGVAAPDGG